MKYYIPVATMTANSPLLEISNSSLDARIASGQRVNEKITVDIVHTGGTLTSSDPVDFMTTPYPVISDKIAIEIKKFLIPSVELVAAKIMIGTVYYDDYFILNSTNLLKCIDFNKSDIRTRSTGAITKIKTLVLDKNIVSTLGEKNRHIFRLEEKSDVYIYSSSLVKKIQGTKPEGLKFIPVEEWYSNIMFDL